MFRFKERGRGSAKNLTINKCDNLACKSVNVDLVRCCVCCSYVCEKCNNIPVNKLKPVADKCSSLYFVCKGCDNNEEVLEVVCNPNEQPEVCNEKVKKVNSLVGMVRRTFVHHHKYCSTTLGIRGTNLEPVHKETDKSD